MQLSLHADYACRTLIYLAIEPQASISQIAKSFGISKNHLVKVVHRLGQEGFIKTTRGKGGGLHLARAAADISIGEVIRKMESGFDLVECFDKKTNSCRIVAACGLKHILIKATSNFLETLDSYSLQDVVQEQKNLRRILSS